MRTVQVWYDFAAPLSFVAHERVRRRWRDLPLRFTWVPWASGLARDGRSLTPAEQRAFAEENLPFKPAKKAPEATLAHRAALWCEARDAGAAADFRDRVFLRLYEHGRDIDHPDVLAGLVESSGLDPIAFLEDMKAGAMAKELDERTAQARQMGLRLAPTFVIGDERIAGDQPWADLDEALRR